MADGHAEISLQSRLAEEQRKAQGWEFFLANLLRRFHQAVAMNDTKMMGKWELEIQSSGRIPPNFHEWRQLSEESNSSLSLTFLQKERDYLLGYIERTKSIASVRRQEATEWSFYTIDMYYDIVNNCLIEIDRLNAKIATYTGEMDQPSAEPLPPLPPSQPDRPAPAGPQVGAPPSVPPPPIDTRSRLW